RPGWAQARWRIRQARATAAGPARASGPWAWIAVPSHAPIGQGCKVYPTSAAAHGGSVVEQRLDRGEPGAGALLLALGVRRRVGPVALEFRGGKFIKEAAGLQPQPAAPLLRLARIRQPQPLLGPGNAHVEQAALLVQAALVNAGLVRQRALGHADHEHAAELQALGRVHAHQPHLVAALVAV